MIRWLQLLLVGVAIATAAGCATFNDPGHLSVQTEATTPTAVAPGAAAPQAAAPGQSVTMYDVEPMQEDVVAVILEGFRSDPWQPYLNSRAPPDQIAQFGRFSRSPLLNPPSCLPQPRPARPPFNLGPVQPSGSFCDALQISLVPQFSIGSGVPSFTRATTATQEDFEGKLNAVLSGEARFQGARRVANLVSGSSNDLTNAAWGIGGAGITLTANYATAPDGTTTATRYVRDAGANGSRYQDFGANARTVSFYGKSNTGATQPLRIMFQGGVAFSSELSLTSSWQRFTVSNANVGVSGPEGNTGATALDILLWGWHVEDVTGQANQNPSEYVSVGVLSAPFHGAGVDGVKYFSTLNGNTVASNVVTEATGAAIVAGAAGVAATAPVDANGPYGEYADPAQTDALGTTAAIRRTMADAGWVASNVTKGTTTGVDGTAASAATLTATAGNGTVLYTTVLGAAVRTYFALVKRVTGTGTVNITGDNGVTWTPITLTSAWQPFYFTTASAANPVVGFRIVTNTDAIAVDFNTLVAGSNLFPYPAPVNVNQAATVDQYVSAGNVPTNDFTVYGEVIWPVIQPAGNYYLWSSYVDANNSTSILWDGTNLVARRRISGANNDATIAFSPTANTRAKWAATFSSTAGTQIYLNGTAGTADATTTACQIGANFQVGADGNGANQPYASVPNVRIWPVALSSGNLTTMTTDAVNWLLPENWAVAANDDYFRKVANQ